MHLRKRARCSREVARTRILSEAADPIGRAIRAKWATDSMQVALVRAGVLLTGYELAKTSLVEGVVAFFTLGLDDSTLRERYEREVLALHSNRVEASLLWLRSQGALTDEHLETVRAARRHRNEVARELAQTPCRSNGRGRHHSDSRTARSAWRSTSSGVLFTPALIQSLIESNPMSSISEADPASSMTYSSTSRTLARRLVGRSRLEGLGL